MKVKILSSYFIGKLLTIVLFALKDSWKNLFTLDAVWLFVKVEFMFAILVMTTMWLIGLAVYDGKSREPIKYVGRK